jgi:hypothetical protein
VLSRLQSSFSVDGSFSDLSLHRRKSLGCPGLGRPELQPFYIPASGTEAEGPRINRLAPQSIKLPITRLARMRGPPLVSLKFAFRI